LSRILEQRGIKHEVLNAKNHKREAEIIAQAGRLGSVTIATNMAGRGTDIVLGGNPETMAWARLQDKYPTRLDVPLEEWNSLVHQIEAEHKMKAMGEEVKSLGGLHVIGSERHDARRIDLQLRGRCGRQGDPGSSRFFLSLDDDLMRIFAGPFVKRVLEMGGFKDDMPIESRMVSRRIDAAQKKREEYNFEIRKSLLEYDEVMDEQRKRIYRFRQRILDGASCREVVEGMIRDQVEKNVEAFLAPDYGQVSFANYAGKQSWTVLDPRLFKNAKPDEAIKLCLDEAERFAETEILNKIEENLSLSEEESEWNWQALAHFVNTRYNLGVRDRDLKAVGRDRVDEFLIDKARVAIQKIEISGAEQMLDPDYGLQSVSVWVHSRFGVNLDVATIRDKSVEQVVDQIANLAIEAYREKEAQYPVIGGLYLFEQPAPAGTTGLLDREGLVQWASRRFGTEISLDDLKNKQREDIRNFLYEKSLQSQSKASQAMEQLKRNIDQLADGGQLPLADSNGAAKSLANWFRDTLKQELPLAKLEDCQRDELEQRLESLVEDHFHPEFRRMERMVLLEIVDTAWKDHLLAMDYLRSAVGQRGMAQLDPKVEYKREGMRLFEGLWVSIGERVTDIVFRVEQLNEDFVSHTLVETSARHDEFQPQRQQPTSDIGREQMDAIENSGKGEYRVEQVRNREAKVGRNDPCPCGSGKKYKVCCMRSQTPG
jgi:preprotein translocase subunit SecA